MDATRITTIQPVTLRRGEHFPPHVRIVREPGQLPTRRVVRTAADLVRALHPMMSVLEVEQFWAVHLNAQGAVLAYSLISSGAVNASLAYPREAFRAAIGSGASSIVFAHNHPSGDPTPSPEDQAVCRQLVAAGKLLDIGVCDFLILTSDPSRIHVACASGVAVTRPAICTLCSSEPAPGDCLCARHRAESEAMERRGLADARAVQREACEADPDSMRLSASLAARWGVPADDAD